MKNALFPNANVAGATFSRAILSEAIFMEADVSGADFSNAKANFGMFMRANASGAIFRDTELTHGDFSHANLKDADFSGATMFRARLHASKQDNTKFSASKAAAQGDNAELLEAELWWLKHRRERPKET